MRIGDVSDPLIVATARRDVKEHNHGDVRLGDCACPTRQDPPGTVVRNQRSGFKRLAIISKAQAKPEGGPNS